MSDIDKRITTMGPDPQREEDPDKGSSEQEDLVMPPVIVAMGDESNDEDDSDQEGSEEEAGPQGDGYMLLPEADQELEPPVGESEVRSNCIFSCEEIGGTLSFGVIREKVHEDR